MSESNAMPIPEDLKEEYAALVEHGFAEAMAFIERIGRAEQRVAELEAALWEAPALMNRCAAIGYSTKAREWTNKVGALLSKGAQPKEGE